MQILLRHYIKLFLPGALVVLLAVSMACGAPGAPAENASAPAASQSQALPAATPVPQQPSQASAASEQPTEPPAAAVAGPEAERPTLKVGVIWLSSPLDPVESGWVANQSAMSENLFRLSESTITPEPWLATGAVQVDPLTWEIEIRPGVKFHNGNALDAEAVKASLERTIRLSAASADNLSIASVAVKDQQTITITTTEPQPTLPGLLTVPVTAIHDAAATEAAGEGNFLQAGALTGPYIPTEYVQKEYLYSVANDDYWGGAPPLAGIDHIAIPDTGSRELALQAGDVYLAINISPEGAQAIDARPGLSTQTSGIGTNVVMWWVNFERGTLADPLVRRAVVQAIDRESIAGLVAPEGSGSFAELMLPEALLSCPGVNALDYDPDQARELLSQAGYADSNGDGIVEKDGQPLEIIIGGYPQRFQLPIMAEAAQAMLADVGIGVDVHITESAAVREANWDLFGWYNNVVETGDPVLNVIKFAGLLANAGSGARNYGHYDNSELVEIVAPARTMSDLEGRKQLACEALALVTEESAYLPVAHPYMVYGVSDRVTGFVPHPTTLYFVDHRIGLTE
ncbi:MAG: hypothetical protein F4X64_13730 [Chloroflexi bacterium]|nr:hypothetical protein [Chloroflexota bacterium]